MDRLAAMQAYVRVVEVGSFTAVARELGTKQSTVSKWIAEPEEELGVTLVERTTRRRRVTEAGELFYDRAREILATWDDVAVALQRNATVLEGRIRMSLPVVFGRLFVVPALPAFLERHPGIELELVFTDRYLDLLTDRIDVAVRVGVPADSSFRSKLLARSQRHVVASPAYLHRHGSPTAPTELADHACLFHSGLSTPEVWTFERGEARHRVAVRGRFSANNSEALMTAAVAGQGIGMLAAWLVEEHVRSGELVVLFPTWDLPPAPVQAVMPPSGQPHRRVAALVEHLRQALSQDLSASHHQGRMRGSRNE